MDWRIDTCPICHGFSRSVASTPGRFEVFQCEECGTFQVTFSALRTLRTVLKDNPGRLREAVESAKQHAPKVSIPKIDSDDVI